MTDDTFQVRLIDGHQVVFRTGAGWRCDCDVWREQRDCAHALKAAALVTIERALQSRGMSIRRH